MAALKVSFLRATLLKQLLHVVCFDIVGSFLKQHEISWERGCGVYTEGVLAVVACHSRFQC